MNPRLAEDNSNRSISIIIPVAEINDYIRESIPEILRLDYQHFEIIIFIDKNTQEYFPKTRVIPTGRIGPAEKRDLAIRYAKGEILAFLDDDAYPRRDWLDKALRHFSSEEVVAVAGPAVTPDDDTLFQKVSGAVFLSEISGGNPDRYWPAKSTKEVDDWPSVNLLLRKDVFSELGGFNSEYWPGEDTKLCLDIVKRGKKIIYDPEVLVYHHRRSGLGRHLGQIGNFGIYRGFFARKYPETSCKLKYFIPTIWFLFLILGTIFSLFCVSNFWFFSAGLIVYLCGLLFALFDIYRKIKDFKVTFLSTYYIIFTHLWYGIRFFQGFVLTKELRCKLR